MLKLEARSNAAQWLTEHWHQQCTPERKPTGCKAKVSEIITLAILLCSTAHVWLTPLPDWSGLHSSTAWPAVIYCNQPPSVCKHATFSKKLSFKSATHLYRAVFWISSKPGNGAIDILTKSPDQARGQCQTFSRQAYACEASFAS